VTLLARKWRAARLALHYRYGRSARNVTRRNSRRAYEKLYAADDLLAEYLGPERLAFYDEVASIAAQYAGRSVVDVGCGSGNLLRALLDRVAKDERVEVERVLALDHARSALRRAAELVPEAEGRIFDVMRDDLGGERFDLVLCTEVLEHVSRPQRARECLSSACAGQGTIVITVPDGAVDAWGGHVNFWTHDEFQAFLEPLGTTTVHRIDADRGLLAIVRPG
jgi:2-polyprenyl-3-methyl-5-hydroxy-6-metoxy-1,4-benzoquinol methylase